MFSYDMLYFLIIQYVIIIVMTIVKTLVIITVSTKVIINEMMRIVVEWELCVVELPVGNTPNKIVYEVMCTSLYSTIFDTSFTT